MDSLDHILRSRFGFEGFRPGQAEAIRSLAAGEHTLVVMPTGAGKSLIYQFAALSGSGVTLVISPLISLMQDQVEALSRRRIPATLINSSISGSEQSERLAAMAENRYRLVYVAPERLRSTAFQDALAKASVDLLAVDEAHCVSQWGHDFRPDYLHIAAARARMGNPLTAALTATATPEVRSDIAKLLGLSQVNHIVTGFNRPNITFEVKYCRDVPGKLRSLMELLESIGDGAAIVYAGTRRDTEEVAQFICEVVGIPAQFYHGGMLAEVREKTQNEFMSGSTRVIVATNSFGMGIDRADVRLVAHYAMPGSLEAYYQEAGRAGRDGEPARAALIYAPDDRSLHEWFIANSALSMDDILALHSALKQESWWSSDDVSVATGLHQVAVRVGLSVLESVGATEVLGTDGSRSLIRQGPLDREALADAIRQAQFRADHKRAQLDRMVNYAESNSCRRRMILNHFGDSDQPSSSRCCDNCLALAGMSSSPDRDESSDENPPQPTLTPENKTALLILDTIRSMPRSVGRGKIAKLLRGSKSRDVTDFGYNRNPRYGKLAVFSVLEIEGLIEKLEALNYIKAVGGRLPVLKLTNQGEAALASRVAIPLSFPRPVENRVKTRRTEGGDTIETTSGLFASGSTPAEIAELRGLTEGTIYGHLAQLIGLGRVELSSVVSRDRTAAIRAAIARVGDTFSVTPVKALLPDEITYGEIRCVIAADSRKACGSEKRSDDHVSTQAETNQDETVPGLLAALDGEDAHIRLSAIKALGKIADPRASEPLQKIASDEKEGRRVRALAEQAAQQCGALKERPIRRAAIGFSPSANERTIPPSTSEDPVAAYLARSHPRPLAGRWKVGWALGFHSSFAGADWRRSGVGDMAFRLKYRGDASALRPLVDEALSLCREHPDLVDVDIIVPVLPSTARALDPVTAFCAELGPMLGLPVREVVIRTRRTDPQKEMRTFAQKRANVAGAFAVNGDVRGRRVLVVDDLYDSGATLEEVVRVLMRAGAASACVLTLTRTIHSDA